LEAACGVALRMGLWDALRREFVRILKHVVRAWSSGCGNNALRAGTTLLSDSNLSSYREPLLSLILSSND